METIIALVQGRLVSNDESPIARNLYLKLVVLHLQLLKTAL